MKNIKTKKESKTSALTDRPDKSKSKKNNKNIGKIGENIVCRYLSSNNYSIIDRNYLKKCGEIDIIAEKDEIIHFIEVKSVTCDNLSDNFIDQYRPEDNVHGDKLMRIRNTVQIFLSEKYGRNDISFAFDVYTVYLDLNNKKFKIRPIKNLVL